MIRSQTHRGTILNHTPPFYVFCEIMRPPGPLAADPGLLPGPGVPLGSWGVQAWVAYMDLQI